MSNTVLSTLQRAFYFITSSRGNLHKLANATYFTHCTAISKAIPPSLEAV